MNVKNLIAVSKQWAKKNSPDILTAIGVVSLVGSIVESAKVTVKSVKMIEDAKNSKGSKLTTPEVIKTVGVNYIPVALSAGVGIGCIVGARKIDHKRQAALMAAYALSENNFKEYKQKVTEILGDKSEEKVKDAIAKDQVANHPVVSENDIFNTGAGDTIFYDPYSSRYFKSSIETVRRALNNLNYRLMNEMWVSVNDLYDEINLAPTKMGDQLGWNINDGLIYVGEAAEFRAVTMPDGRPCLVLDTDVSIAPRYSYN